MAHDRFDACITLNDHHLAAAALSGRKTEAVAAVRQAVEQMAGAGWIDVEAHSYPANLPGWIILYPRGRAAAPDTPAWRELRHTVEVVATAALIGAAVPF
jgi:hypothetical protein